jgi:hypothetical protein
MLLHDLETMVHSITRSVTEPAADEIERFINYIERFINYVASEGSSRIDPERSRPIAPPTAPHTRGRRIRGDVVNGQDVNGAGSPIAVNGSTLERETDPSLHARSACKAARTPEVAMHGGATSGRLMTRMA